MQYCVGIVIISLKPIDVSMNVHKLKHSCILLSTINNLKVFAGLLILTIGLLGIKAQERFVAYPSEFISGIEYLSQKDTAGAMEQFQKLTVHQENSEALYQLALLNYLKKTKEGIRNSLGLVERAIKSNNNEADYWYLRGNIYYLLIEKEIAADKRAIESYEKVLRFNPNHIDSYIKLGIIYRNLMTSISNQRMIDSDHLIYFEDVFRKSKFYFESAINRDNNDNEAKIELVLLIEAMNKVKKALKR